MPVLTELDLNASCEDYCNTLLSRRNRYSGWSGNVPVIVKGVECEPATYWLSPNRPIPQGVLDKFEEKKKIVCSQKERFSPNLFKILEKTHFENLLPYLEEPYMSLMPRKESTDIFIAYAEEFHRLEQSNKEIVLKLEYLQQSIRSNIDIVNSNFKIYFEELKRDFSNHGGAEGTETGLDILRTYSPGTYIFRYGGQETRVKSSGFLDS